MNKKILALSFAFIAIVAFGGFFFVSTNNANAIIDGDCVGCDDLPYKPGGGYGGGSTEFGGGVPTYGGGTPPSAPPSCSISVNSPVVSGGQATVTWTGYNTGGGSLFIGTQEINVGANGSYTFTPNGDTSIQLIVIGSYSYQVADCATSVTITPPHDPAPICDFFNANPTTITKGDSTLLAWGTTNATSVSINQGIGAVAVDGSKTVSPTSNTTYTLTAVGAGGTETCTAYVKVKDTPPPAPTCDFFTADPTLIQKGNSSTLEWGTTNATSVSINQGIGAVAVDGSEVVSPTDTTTYTLTAVGAGGTATCTAKVKVKDTPPPAPTCDFFTADPTVIETGQLSRLEWGTTNATSVSINQGIGAVAVDGDKIVQPSGTTTYTLTATGTGGTATCTAKITVKPPVNDTPVCSLVASPTTIDQGQSSTLTWSTERAVTFVIDHNVGTSTPVAGGTTSVSPSTTTTYTGVATSVTGKTVTCNATVTVQTPDPVPLCTLSASPTSIDEGQSSTLSWTTTNAVSFVVDKGVGNVTPVPAGSKAVTPTTTTLYTGTATSATGKTVTCTAEVAVVPVGITPQCTLSVSASQIVTGQSVTVSWTSANVTSGFIDNNVGTTTPVSSGSREVFPGSSTQYTGTFTGPNGAVSCTAQVTVTTGGCTQNCGGGLDQPSVSLFNKPGDQPLAFVSLSQIPYTGFEAGPLLTILFWMAIGLWSLGITYLFFGKESMKLFARRVLGFDLAFVAGARSENRDDDLSEDISSNSALQSTMTTPSVPATLVTEMPAAAPAPATEYVPSLEDVIESRAHAAGVLLSPEAVKMATDLGDSRLETLQKFGKILDEAVKKVPREDGWILLSTDRLVELAKNGKEEVLEATLPETDSKDMLAKEVLSESAHEQIARAVLTGDREAAAAIVRAHEAEGADAGALMVGVVTVIDGLYRARKTGVATNVMLEEKSAHVSDEKLMKLIELFTKALDTVYASKYTGVKLAIAQAFEV